MGTVRLKHTLFRGDGTFFFYEGERPVKEGVLELESENPDFENWVRRAYINGYNLDPDTEDVVALEDVLAGASGDDGRTPAEKAAETRRRNKEAKALEEEARKVAEADERRRQEGQKAEEREAEERRWRRENVDEVARREQEEMGTTPEDQPTATEVAADADGGSAPEPANSPS